MKRVMRFGESKVYHFTLDSDLEKGELEVRILDSSRQPIIILNRNNRSGRLDVDKKKRYYLVFEFQSASGSYELTWE